MRHKATDSPNHTARTTSTFLLLPNDLVIGVGRTKLRAGRSGGRKRTGGHLVANTERIGVVDYSEIPALALGTGGAALLPSPRYISSVLRRCRLQAVQLLPGRPQRALVGPPCVQTAFEAGRHLL